ncbi:unnamed protein product [Arctia plantaginis]|uniref:Uncharacterized protein n=1 Tax=Arctia plantaginis TaxID=874455 RepID=A0A8S0ZGW8_ARCPL|nr:unnamed protein product [Arctia plantaginis]
MYEKKNAKTIKPFFFKLRMIDFQEVRYSSLAIDLNCILYLCIERNLRTHHFDALKFYGDEFGKRVFQMSVKGSGLLIIIDEKKLDEL